MFWRAPKDTRAHQRHEDTHRYRTERYAIFARAKESIQDDKDLGVNEGIDSGQGYQIDLIKTYQFRNTTQDMVQESVHSMDKA